MVGRDGPLTQLEDTLSLALGGQRQIIFVTGEAGIGKTVTLVDMFQQHVHRQPNVRILREGNVLRASGAGGIEAYLPDAGGTGLTSFTRWRTIR